jgi:hypothetical protein
LKQHLLEMCHLQVLANVEVANFELLKLFIQLRGLQMLLQIYIAVDDVLLTSTLIDAASN